MKLILSLQQYDIAMFMRLNRAEFFQVFTLMARYISKTGDGTLYAFLVIFLFITKGIDNLYLQTIVLGFFIERPLYYILKNSFKRNRPNVALKDFQSLITPSDQFSLPSGHTSGAFLMAVITSIFYPVLFLPLMIWATLIGFSRVILGVHFPTDILAGMSLGVSVALYSINHIISI